METKDALSQYFTKVIEGIKEDAASKGQKIPVSSFRHEETNQSGQFLAADYFKYLVFGREPGKAPPPDAMLKFVESSPETAAWKQYEKQSLAYVIGQKIAKEGTDIYSGKKQGIDLLGVMEKNMPDLLKVLAQNEAINIATSLRQAIR